MRLYIPEGYKPSLSIRETEQAIKEIKDLFQDTLAKALHLTRVSAPLMVFPETGLNDNLSGIERPVVFHVPDTQKDAEIVHSLAKWKRVALKRYGFAAGEGLYTDMNAIRRDEYLDNIHSIYVDQWDWEKIITHEERTLQTLTQTVNIIFHVFKAVESGISACYPQLDQYLPEKVTFISAKALTETYPSLTPKEREEAVCRKYRAVFITQIGDTNADGEKHDDRAPDYDDWSLNGDLLFYYPVLGCVFEVTSMGIRVDEGSLLSQIKKAGCEERLALPYHQAVLHKELPYTIGGGLGQSRICMFLLGKAHIGEVQSAVWPPDMETQCQEANIPLL